MRIDPSINYFAIIHERLGTNDDSASDNEVMDRILYYYPFEATNGERLSTLKFIESMIVIGLKFSKDFNDGIKTVTMKKSTIGFIEVENDCWFVVSILNDGGINKGIINLRPQLFVHRPNSQSILGAMKHLYFIITTTNGSINALLSGEDNEGWEHIETVRIARKRYRKLETLLDEELLQDNKESKRVKELQFEIKELMNEIQTMIHSQELAIYTPLMVSNLLKSYLDWFLLTGEMSTPNITHSMIGYHKADSTVTVMKRLSSIRNSLSREDNVNISSSPFTGSIMVLFDGTLLNSDFPVSTTTSLCSLCRMLDESTIRNAFNVQPWTDVVPIIMEKAANLDPDCNDSISNEKQSTRRKSTIVQSSNNPKRGSVAKGSVFFRRRSTSSDGTNETGINLEGGVVFGNANKSYSNTIEGHVTNNNMSRRPKVVRYDAKNAMEGFAAWTVGFEESIGFLTPNWKCADFSNTEIQFQTPVVSPTFSSKSAPGSGSEFSTVVESESRANMDTTISATSTSPHKSNLNDDGHDCKSVNLDSELQTSCFTQLPSQFCNKLKFINKNNVNSRNSNVNSSQIKWPFTLWCPKLHKIHDMNVSSIGHVLCYRKGKFLLFMQLKSDVRPGDMFLPWTNICKSTHDILNVELDLLFDELTEVHNEANQPAFFYDLSDNPSNNESNCSNNDTDVKKNGSKSSNIKSSRRLSQKIAVNAMQERNEEESESPKSSIFNLNIFGTSAQPRSKARDSQNKSNSRIIFYDSHLGIYRASNIVQGKRDGKGRYHRSASFTGTSSLSLSVPSALRAPHPIINWPHAAHLPLHYDYYQNDSHGDTNADSIPNSLWSPGIEGSSINYNKIIPKAIVKFDAQSLGDESIVSPKPNGGFGFLTPDLNYNIGVGTTVDDHSVSHLSMSIAISGIGVTTPVRVEYGVEVEKLLRIRPKYPHASGFIGSNIEPVLLVAITDIHTQLKRGAKEAFSRVTTTKRGAVWAYGRIPESSSFSCSSADASMNLEFISPAEQQCNQSRKWKDSIRDSHISYSERDSDSSVDGSDQQHMCLFLVDNASKVLDLFSAVSPEMQVMLL